MAWSTWTKACIVSIATSRVTTMGIGYIYGEVGPGDRDSLRGDCPWNGGAYSNTTHVGPAAHGRYGSVSARNPDGAKRFEWRGGKSSIQHSLVNPGQEWRVHLVKDSVDSTIQDYNERSRARQAHEP